ncbi:alpha/beta fold hydrolase [Desulforamulus aeronauticus]|uniref:Pimeloyl-ACP methyl ester carboxylesterase n=1 Tax=Desulforamulus aeronauticus DSM 10349 TaxID=1121421 RepID=A0A1M6RJQ9_9FIRM|nr:alpha/beta hydrolase [Desulforamulus aeronauticus]SHK32598.1 Pimeloyl-ACP methyl ester carboxylesterase [Desulforamulus aeronauticus DSM 10349]
MITELKVKKVKLENGELLAYRETGEGNKNILLVHGNMCSGVHFLPLIKRFSPNFKVYIIDLRGFGDSTYINRVDNIKDISDDLYTFINKLEITNFTLVGWSAGGSVCLQFSANYPDIVEKIVLIDSVGYMGCPLFKKDEQGNVLIGQIYKDRLEMAKDPEVAPCLKAIENNNFNDMSTLWDMAIYTNHKPLPEDNKLFINATLKQRNLVDIYWALSVFNLSNKHNGYTEGNNLINKIKVPVLSFWGEKDMIVSGETVRETVKVLGDKAELVILKDSGHSPLVDCPDILMQKMIDFII